MAEELNRYRNLIVGEGDEPVESILFNEDNWRIHPLEQQEALEGVFEDVGVAQRIIINMRTSPEWGDSQNVQTLVDGHARVKIFAKHHEPTIPALYIDATPREEALILATLDPIGGMAATDKEKLDDLFEMIDTENERVLKMLDEMAKRERLDYNKPTLEDVEPQIDKADELQEKWQVQTGQVWQLGNHRIICGDCNDPAVVQALMGEEKATICWTDPPWNVAYGTSFNNTRTDNPLGWKKRTIVNDNLGDEFGAFAAKFCDGIREALVPGGILYMAMSAQEWGLIMNQLEESGFHWSSTIIWAKDTLVVSRKDYHTQYEPVWYGWKDDAARVCEVEDRKQSDLWMIPRPKVSEEHPTMKPVELVERSLNNSSHLGDIVYEPFAGSGTDIIACERLNRKCRAIEIDPKYVAVSIQRWVDVTGGTPVLIDGDQQSGDGASQSG